MAYFRRLVGVGVALGLMGTSVLLAGCGGGGDDDSNVSLSNVNSSSSSPAAEQPRTEATVEVKDNSFSPDTITVKAGTKITWKWVGTANSHSVQISGQTSPEQTSGTFERTFDQGGISFTYQCGVHKAAMTGRIVVE